MVGYGIPHFWENGSEKCTVVIKLFFSRKHERLTLKGSLCRVAFPQLHQLVLYNVVTLFLY